MSLSADLPEKIEDWTKDHVYKWLISSLGVSKVYADQLYHEDVSGSDLVFFEIEDLTKLGIKYGPAVKIVKNVRQLKVSPGRILKFQTEEDQDASKTIQTSMQTASPHMFQQCSISNEEKVVKTNISLASESDKSPADAMCLKNVDISLGTDIKTELLPSREKTYPESTIFKEPELEEKLPYPFDKSHEPYTYSQHDILPAEKGPSNLIEPVHEYKLLGNTEHASEAEVLKKFSNEVFRFAAACMNSRTNGTIHFGVGDEPHFTHGEVIGISVPSPNKFVDHFNKSLKDYFTEHTNIAKNCIRQPRFVQVLSLDTTMSNRYVIEVDVVPSFSLTRGEVFNITMITCDKQGKKHKEDFLFVRDGASSKNILANKNIREVLSQLSEIKENMKFLVSRREASELEGPKEPGQSNQGQRLKRLIGFGKDTLENSLYSTYVVVTNKCHPSELEFLQFLREMKLFAVLEFDPESALNGVCNFFRKDRIANLHYPRNYNTGEAVSVIIGKLNLFRQTSWVFCNGRTNGDSEADQPFTPSEWLKKRAGEVKDVIHFLCNPDVLPTGKSLVMFLLHSDVTEISDPVLETFCTFYQKLEGADNMLCICKNASIFSYWKDLVDIRCKMDITSKCIYDLNLNEINGTILKLKQPHTQSSSRFLPSSGSSSVLLVKKDEDLMTALDIVCENECENTEIEKNACFDDFKNIKEEDFYRGGKVTWWNFYFSETPGSLPFIKRDKYEELYNLITPDGGFATPCVILNLFHHPGCGGTTLAMHVLWNLRKKFRCAVLKNNTTQNTEIAVQVIHLLTCGKGEQSTYTPVLLLVDDWEEMESIRDLHRCILNAAPVKQKQETLMVVILNCMRSQFPAESSKNSLIDSVYITNKLSQKEQGFFEAKLNELRVHHEKPETFYAFMIMKSNFNETYIKNVVHNTLKDLNVSTKEAQLVSFLALLNSYVNGSSMSVSLCEEFVGIKNALWGRETLEEKMNPYSTLLIRFNVEEYGTYQGVRFLHQMIANHCLQVLTKKHNLKLCEMTTNLLHCDMLYKSGMGKDILIQNIQSMLITRQRREYGDDKDTLFSPLIEQMQQEEGTTQIKDVLVEATKRFDKNATIPQALARHFYLREKDFESALKWAQDAKHKKYNSYIADTLGQVFKSKLKHEIECAEAKCKILTPEDLEKYLQLAQKATKAFKDSQDLANSDDSTDTPEYRKKKHSTYNTSGHIGEMDVAMIIFDVVREVPFFKSDELNHIKMMNFLKNKMPISSLHEDDSEVNSQFISVLQNHEKFLVTLKPQVKETFVFFENYFTYLKPRSIEKQTAEDRNKRKVSDHFKKYIKLFCSSETERQSERVNQPKLSLQQNIEDQRRFLEEERADTFSGLLQCLNEKKGYDMQKILNSWSFIYKNSTKKSLKDTTNIILANIVLYCINRKSASLMDYTTLTALLNEALQEEGTHSNCTELYYLAMLLLWPGSNVLPENAFKNICTYVTSIRRSFHRRFAHVCRTKSAIAHFYLGKSTQLRRIVHKAKLDNSLGPEKNSKNSLWQSGAIWKEKTVQNLLLRVKGTTENGDVYVHYDGNLKIPVRPVYLGGVRSGYSIEEVSFYLGFSMEGPVAYNIEYINDS
nr:PREDICTED: sterile alpha motif domain-containing protein 9-like [Lepisosteus oculatus]